MPTRVVVVGAGPVGLITMKNLLEEGFEVTAYEARPFVGGLWRPSEDKSLSCIEGTIFNSSKYRSAIPDFPFPDDTDDFPTWRQIASYLESYCDHFNLRDKINLNCEVTGLRHDGNKWMVEYRPKDGAPRIDRSDKVVIAIGTFVVPKQPSIPGSDLFAGKILHSIKFHRPAEFDGQNVLLIGLHATAQDVAVSLSGRAKKIYVAHRNGVRLIPRYMPDGVPLDLSVGVRMFFVQDFMARWCPRLFDWMINKAVASMSSKMFPETPKRLTVSVPPVYLTLPLVGDEVYELMKTGFVEPVSMVQGFTGPKQLRLKDGSVLEDIDSVIFCTGYHLDVPFLPEEYNPYPAPGDAPSLYHNVFPLHPDSRVRESLAFVGHGAVAFPGFVQYELQVMAIAHAWKGNSPLPSYDEMKAWHRRHVAWRKLMVSREKLESTFYQPLVEFSDHMRWLNWAAGTGIYEHFGWFSRRAWALWWRDRELYRKFSTGAFSPALWRLFDMGKRKPWSGAREQVFLDNEEVKRLVQKRKDMILEKENLSKKIV